MSLGFPESNMQVFEIYNSAAQTRARTHPALLQTQRAILQLWHTSDPNARLSLGTPVSYYDRLRIRQPGDRSFALVPHIDGGSIERWEDPGFRACFGAILSGRWREHDPFDAAPRLHASQDLYEAPYVPFPSYLPSYVQFTHKGFPEINARFFGPGRGGPPCQPLVPVKERCKLRHC
jgi:Protein of unknown function (DUF1479)